MRSAAVLLCSHRRAQRRSPRCAARARSRGLRRTPRHDAPRVRDARGTRRAAPRLAKPRERIVHVIPRGFLPLVRH
ncbi:MAG: hypothetical protein BroJett026_20490 [Betaproteobacteria bacterium]|nr:MAG: hypothetical protein BroJett026_20490 [Betaproteobacteria bacterium]